MNTVTYEFMNLEFRKWTAEKKYWLVKYEQQP